MTKFNSPLGKA